MLLFFVSILIFNNIIILNISQNLINLLVFFIIFFIISIIYKKISIFNILLKEKEQSVFLEFLIRLKLLICFYIKYIEVELYSIYIVFLELIKTLENALSAYSWILIKSHKYLVNKSVYYTLNRIVDSSAIIYKQLN